MHTTGSSRVLQYCTPGLELCHQAGFLFQVQFVALWLLPSRHNRFFSVTPSISYKCICSLTKGHVVNRNSESCRQDPHGGTPSNRNYLGIVSLYAYTCSSTIVCEYGHHVNVCHTTYPGNVNSDRRVRPKSLSSQMFSFDIILFHSISRNSIIMTSLSLSPLRQKY